MLPRTMSSSLPPLMAGPLPMAGTRLAAAATLVRERRAEPRYVAHLLLGDGGQWDPSRGALAVVNRVTDTARASLPLACAMTHHVRGSLMLSAAGVPSDDREEMTWALGEADLETRPDSGWSVTGSATTCCPPPDRDVRFVVLSHRLGHVLSVPMTAAASDGRPSAVGDVVGGARPAIGLTTHPGGETTVSFHAASATVHGPFSQELLGRVSVLADLLEAAAWYGALTRIADGLVAIDTDDEVGCRVPDLTLAETDALLGATWASIREGVGLWERDGCGAATIHHTARARTMARTSAATMLAGYVHDEYTHARRDPGAAEAREHLVSWMGRRPWSGDIDVVATALRREGPSW